MIILLYDLSKMILGELPPQLEFLYPFGMLFFLAIFLFLIFTLISITADFLRGL